MKSSKTILFSLTVLFLNILKIPKSHKALQFLKFWFFNSKKGYFSYIKKTILEKEMSLKLKMKSTISLHLRMRSVTYD